MQRKRQDKTPPAQMVLVLSCLSFKSWESLFGSEKIAELADGQRIWTPGKEIGSGVYLVKATTKEGESITKRIVFMK